MKGYAWLILAVAALLLLIPLPALPHAAPPESSGESDVALPDDTALPEMPESTDSGGETPAADVFRILNGDQVIQLEEREFLLRTLAFEMSPTYHSEALKAQAVAAYTYYSRRRAAQRQSPDAALKGADFASPDSRFPEEYSAERLRERWGGQFDVNYHKLCAAVDAVFGKTITCGGSLIDACYFAISSGSTESAAVVWGSEVSYLQAVASPGDRLSPGFETRVTLTPEQVRDALSGVEGMSLGEDPAGWFGQPVCSAAGTVTELSVGGTTLSGTRLRSLLGLRSACFSVSYGEGGFCFIVHGYGHGVGMSQYGADYLARQGYGWEEILHYYYTGVTIG